MEMSGLVYTCSAGETYDSIALDVFGDSRFAAELMQANPGMTDTCVFAGGEKLDLPVVEVNETGSAYTPQSAPWRR